ncbi:hypothetical protein GCM10007424_16210 [Flavobacterium suaedae]|uniref:Uncharacterized protein n=1 Tax=Flavobacterium suaedae TaxID=1767027 RepID=A0ABQ1JUL3_9FLAO|nr:hypothetical protein [Flavobacterium suaedae]GGB76914.1 hypothetical protein GCM10007424_16210 [Flavobacterium suaedae]
MNVWVYDNQLGYYNALKTKERENLCFMHVSMNQEEKKRSIKEDDFLVFFLSDDIELMDFIKLCKTNVTSVFCSPYKTEVQEKVESPHIYYIDINLNMDALMEAILSVLEKEQNYNQKKPTIKPALI